MGELTNTDQQTSNNAFSGMISKLMGKTQQNSSNDSETSKNVDVEKKFELPEVYKNISVNLEVLVGRQTLTIEDLVNNARIGSIIELDEPLGEPVQIFINNEEFAKGTLVVVNEKYGVRIDEIL